MSTPFGGAGGIGRIDDQECEEGKPEHVGASRVNGDGADLTHEFLYTHPPAVVHWED